MGGRRLPSTSHQSLPFLMLTHLTEEHTHRGKAIEWRAAASAQVGTAATSTQTPCWGPSYWKDQGKPAGQHCTIIHNAQNLHRFTAVNPPSSLGGGILQQGACGTGGTEDKTAQPWSGWLRTASYKAAEIELCRDQKGQEPRFPKSPNSREQGFDAIQNPCSITG